MLSNFKLNQLKYLQKKFKIKFDVIYYQNDYKIIKYPILSILLIFIDKSGIFLKIVFENNEKCYIMNIQRII